MSSQTLPGKPEASPKSESHGYTKSHVFHAAYIDVEKCRRIFINHTQSSEPAVGLYSISFPNCCLMTSWMTSLMLTLQLGCWTETAAGFLVRCRLRFNWAQWLTCFNIWPVILQKDNRMCCCITFSSGSVVTVLPSASICCVLHMML